MTIDRSEKIRLLMITTTFKTYWRGVKAPFLDIEVFELVVWGVDWVDKFGEPTIPTPISKRIRPGDSTRAKN